MTLFRPFSVIAYMALYEYGCALQAIQCAMNPVPTDSTPADVYAGAQALTCVRKVRIWRFFIDLGDFCHTTYCMEAQYSLQHFSPGILLFFLSLLAICNSDYLLLFTTSTIIPTILAMKLISLKCVSLTLQTKTFSLGRNELCERFQVGVEWPLGSIFIKKISFYSINKTIQ